MIQYPKPGPRPHPTPCKSTITSINPVKNYIKPKIRHNVGVLIIRIGFAVLLYHTYKESENSIGS